MTFNKNKNFACFLIKITYSDRERELIFCMKEVGASWKNMAKAVGKNITAVKMYWKRTHERKFLPPKEIKYRHVVLTKLKRTKVTSVLHKNLR